MSEMEVIPIHGPFPWGVWDDGDCIAGFENEADAKAFAQMRSDPHNVAEQAFCQWCQRVPCECGNAVFMRIPSKPDAPP
jgi:hypothetical protein